MSLDVDLLLTDARIHLPGSEVVEGWLSVTDGRIAAIGASSPPAARAVHDAGGRDVIPGGVDIHTHFRDPGDTHKEDFSTGTLAAAFGGITTVVDMPNTGSQLISPDDFREKRDGFLGRSWVDFGLHATFHDSSAHVRELADLGVAGLKWMLGYGEWKGLRCQPKDLAEAHATLVEAAAADVLVLVHAESLPWIRDLSASLREAGRNDVRVHADSRPPFVEAISVAEAIIAAAACDARLHIVHLTADVPLRTAVALREALGAVVTVETCPSYLFLTDEDVDVQGVAIQVNPPMRSRSDQEALWEGIRARQIDSVASDHAPTVPDDKVREYPLDVLPGVVGVETMLPLLLDAVVSDRLTLARMIELVCRVPAEVVHLDHRKGALIPGHDADLVIVDLDGHSIVAGHALHSKQKFTPYEGRELRGAIQGVFVRGSAVVIEGRLVAETPHGVHTPSRYRGSAAMSRVPEQLAGIA